MIRSRNSKNRQYNEQKIPKEMIRSINSQNRQYNEQKIPKEMIRSVKKSRTDNTMNKDIKRDDQKP